MSLREALRHADRRSPHELAEVIADASASFGGRDATLYLQDLAQITLTPLRPRVTGDGIDSAALPIDGSLQGRAFVTNSPVLAQPVGGAQRRYSPIVSGGERLGVLGVTVGKWTDALCEQHDDLARLVGDLLVAANRRTDAYTLARRQGTMTVAAELQWAQLPPLASRSPHFAVAGMVEAAYDVGGDLFDYALNDHRLDLSILDVVGHDLEAAHAASLLQASWRHSRRSGLNLVETLTAADALAARAMPPGWFATGQLAQLDGLSGVMSWVNAGHPLPLHLRAARLVNEMQCPPRLPIGITSDTQTSAHVATTTLEPGDRVLFFTDGVIEGGIRRAEAFGRDRLIELATKASLDELDCDETLRRIGHAVLQHNEFTLRDDATLLLVEWSG